MPRHLRLLTPLLVALLAMAIWPPHATHAAPASIFKMDVQISAERLMRVQCDGDSVPITVRITRVSDGSPVAGAIVNLDGVPMVTNRRGIVRGAITPAIQIPTRYAKRTFFIGASSDGVDTGLFYLRDYACPFPSGEFGLAVHMFVDENGDGIVNEHEPAFAERDVTLGFTGSTRKGTLNARTFKLNKSGALSMTLAWSGYGVFPGPRGMWVMCLTDRELAKGWRVVSA